MKTPLAATVLTTLAIAIPGASTAAAGPIATTACSRDVPATIGGAHKCLGAGEYCATRYERQYERYGFVCGTSYRPPRLKRS